MKRLFVLPGAKKNHFRANKFIKSRLPAGILLSTFFSCLLFNESFNHWHAHREEIYKRENAKHLKFGPNQSKAFT